MHTDGYAPVAEPSPAPVREVACLAHVRRKFFDVHAAQGSAIAADFAYAVSKWMASGLVNQALSSCVVVHRTESAP